MSISRYRKLGMDLSVAKMQLRHYETSPNRHHSILDWPFAHIAIDTHERIGAMTIEEHDRVRRSLPRCRNNDLDQSFLSERMEAESKEERRKNNKYSNRCFVHGMRWWVIDRKLEMPSETTLSSYCKPSEFRMCDVVSM